MMLFIFQGNKMYRYLRLNAYKAAVSTELVSTCLLLKSTLSIEFILNTPKQNAINTYYCINTTWNRIQQTKKMSVCLFTTFLR